MENFSIGVLVGVTLCHFGYLIGILLGRRWKNIKVSKKNRRVAEAEQALLRATEKWISSNGDKKDAEDVSYSAVDLLVELFDKNRGKNGSL